MVAHQCRPLTATFPLNPPLKGLLMSTHTTFMNRTATTFLAAVFVIAAGAGIASAESNGGSANAPDPSFSATIGGASVGPLSVPGVQAGPGGVDVGGLRVPTPAPFGPNSPG